MFRTVVLNVFLLVGLVSPALAQETQWSALYQQFDADARIPEHGSAQKSEHLWVVEDDVVDMGDVLGSSAWQQQQPLVTYIYADLLRIPAGFMQVMEQQGLIVVARRVEVDASAYLYIDYQNGPTGFASFYVDTWTGSMNVVAFESLGSATHFSLQNSEHLESTVLNTGAGPSLAQSNTLPGGLFTPELKARLARTYLIASIVDAGRVADKIDLLGWVARLARQGAGDEAFAELALESSALLGFWRSSRGGRHVPYLDQDIYFQQGEAYLAALERYQDAYDRFSDREADLALRIADAERMLGDAADAVELRRIYLAQAHANVDDTNDTLDQAVRQLDSQRLEVELARIHFEHGLIEWEHDARVEAAFNAIQAIVTFGSAVALTVTTGQGQLTLEALVALVEAGAAFAIELGQALDDLSAVLDSSQELLDGSGVLYETATAAEDMSLAVGALEDLQGFESELALQSDAWQRFNIEAEHALVVAIDAGVEGAREYQAALQTLAVAGETVLKIRGALMRAMLEAAQIETALYFEERSQARLSDLVAAYTGEQQATAALEQAFFDRLIELKRPFVLALLNYGAAFEYWSLADADMSISLLQHPLEYRVALADIERRYADALSSFSRPPQPFLNRVKVFDDAASLESFHRTGELRFTLDMDEPAFYDLDRVRLGGVRVWLETVDSVADEAVLIDVETSGQYRDRLGFEDYEFQGRSMSRGFAYYIDDDGEPVVLLEGTLADEFQFAYFEPTPFTTWSVSLASPEFDRSRVTGIRVEWYGNGIAAF
ncbi:hypothetical protein [Haliangium ochraceum]|uniref:Uncharacterized protein n=1 Tax=Haliangium ochraceum (strain DSM 14365 / JCM 11303 / SMP-2) TaxID=502025 RepID=D0LUR4_HALO1|nr:hypothetical protein [Haliangium ochraceum]ACY13954.1 hypothetical protein Hoch_1400 [Haliangium ochraceum DSM 14365]